jgi:hypothetical protein
MTQPGEVGYWRPVVDWCLGANDHFGTCFLAMVGNHHVIVTTANGAAEVMTDGEIERADSVMTGFVASDPLTNRGLSVEEMLTDWARDGWPGDPTLKPVFWRPIEYADVPTTIDQLAAAYTWVMLPKDVNGDYDFSDDAVARGAVGVAPHAMLAIGAEPGFCQVVTWATLKTVSDAWFARFGRGYFAVRHPAWGRPGGEILA